MIRITITAVAMALATSAAAQDAVTWTVEDSFENITFAIESAIVGQGLVIDHVSHVGEMLERTRADVGSDRVLYTAADIFSFCSSTVSRAVMEADIANIQHCPYGIFVHETPDAPGTITVGHRAYDGSMAPVGELLTAIVKEALGQD
ncbi:DUF302 domain-containing protein [Paracoccaceae bacterium Fryx2]|nr:DUF302 domain-containing protein [Paracoccaceae bacterium Fryx2]